MTAGLGLDSSALVIITILNLKKKFNSNPIIVEKFKFRYMNFN